MSGTRIALVALVAALAWAAWPMQPVIFDTHRAVRQLVIRSTLARTDDAIVILGDSIVEASTMPRSLCGHAIINAGIGSASTASNLGSMLAESLGNKQAALVVVSLGTNDAAIPHSVAQYQSNYRALLRKLAALTLRSVVLNSCSVLQTRDWRQSLKTLKMRARPIGPDAPGTGNAPWSIGEPIRW
jgi:hypothetical protein